MFEINEEFLERERAKRLSSRDIAPDVYTALETISEAIEALAQGHRDLVKVVAGLEQRIDNLSVTLVG
jgi:hypothetical protein